MELKRKKERITKKEWKRKDTGLYIRMSLDLTNEKRVVIQVLTENDTDLLFSPVRMV